MQVDLKKISTESRNKNTMNIDQMSTIEMLKAINNEDKTVAFAVEKSLGQIALLVDEVYETFRNNGRLIYIGAGTSGRLGVLDASECPPTYGVDNNMVIGLIAGGNEALVNAVEGAEDSKELAVEDLKGINLSNKDIVVGIAASGRTPYVIGGIEYAKEIGAITGCITTSAGSKLADLVEYPVEAITGPEPITGSTRMKSGTAQKMICNMISTCAMIKMGKVYENLMIDLKATNEKLVSRMLSIIKEITGYSNEIAKQQLEKFKSVKGVLLSYLTKIENPNEIQKILEENNGNIREAISNLNEEGIKKCK